MLENVSVFNSLQAGVGLKSAQLGRGVILLAVGGKRCEINALAHRL